MRLDLPLGTPPGEYELRIAVYDPQTLAPITDGEGQGEVAVQAVRFQFPDHRPVPENKGAPAGARLGRSIILADYQITTTEPLPGETVELELLWRRGEEPPTVGAPTLFVQIVDDDGNLLYAEESPLGGADRPPERWSPGELVRTRHRLRLPADTPSGGYALLVGLLDPADHSLLPLRARGMGGDGPLRLATLAVVAREPLPAPDENLATVSGAAFGDSLRLRAYQVEPPTVQPGETVQVQIQWETLEVMGADYHLFLHLTAPDDLSPLAQADSWPGPPDLPTARWLPQEVLAATIDLEIPADLPAGSYRLQMGLYEPATGQRLAVTDPAGLPTGDSLDLGSVTVRADSRTDSFVVRT
jgi:hypothetical protein